MAQNYFDQGYESNMERKDKKYPQIFPDEIGESVAFLDDKDILGKLRGSIFRGTSSAELVFFDQGGKSGGAPSPETLGKETRQALRDMALINEVKTTTHASPKLSNITGVGRSGYSELSRKEAVNEIKKAIDFSSQATTGGAVVFHTGEFPRSIAKAKFAEKEHIEAFTPEEKYEEYAQYYLYDPTERQILPIATNKAQQLWLEDEKKIDKISFDDYKDRKYGELAEKLSPDEEFELAKEYYGATQQAAQLIKKGEIQTVKRRIMEIEGLKRDLQHKYDRESSEEKKQKIQQLMNSEDDSIKSYKAQIEGYNLELRKEKEKIGNLKPFFDFAKTKTSKSLAELGMFAMQKSREGREAMPEDQKDKFHDIYIAPENIFPEQYGASPDELKDIVVSGREAMAKELLERNIARDESEAKKIASKHIRATFDTGHANIWYKYFKPDDKTLSEEERRKQFSEWLTTEFKKLVKEDIIGHIHLTDNLGYDDEHLVIGQGKAPIQDFLKVIEKESPHLLKEMVVEAGGHNFQTILHDTWRELSSPIYSLDRSQSSHARTFQETSTSYLQGSRRSYAPSLFSSKDKSRESYLGKSSYTGLDFR